MRVPNLVLTGLLVVRFAFAQTENEPKQFVEQLTAAKALLAQAPPNLLYCGDTGWQVDKAREHCQAALALSPENSDALTTMGSILYRKGMYTSASERDKLFQQAMTYHRKAIEANPNNADAHQGIAELLQMDLMQRMDKTLIQAKMWMGQKRPLGRNTIPEDIRRKYQTDIEDVVRHAQFTLETDPQAINALFALAEVTRVRAYLASSQQEFESNLREVDTWYRKISAIPQKLPPARSCDVGRIVGSVPSQAPQPPK